MHARGAIRVAVLTATMGALAGPVVDPGSGAIDGVAADPVRPVFYASTGLGELVRIDVATASITARLTVAAGPGAMSIEPSGARLYVGLRTDPAVAIVDLASFTLAGTIGVSASYGVGGIVLGRPGRLYAA